MAETKPPDQPDVASDTHGLNVAVIDHPNSKQAVVWWVRVGGGLPGAASQLCGAWTLDASDLETIGSVVCRAIWVPTREGLAFIERNEITKRPILDTDAAVQTIAARRRELMAAYTREVATGKNKHLADLALPGAPEPFNLDRPPKATDAPEQVQTALGVARWVESLDRCWHTMESRRLARPYMRKEFGEDRKAMPITFR